MQWKTAVVAVNVIISALVIVTARFQSTFLGQFGYITVLCICSALPFLVRRRSTVIGFSTILLAVYVIAFRALFYPLTDWLTNNRNAHDARAYLRLISSEQDQYWLQHGRYTANLQDLFRDAKPSGKSFTVNLRKATTVEWVAEVRVGSAMCTWGKQRKISVAERVSLEPLCKESGEPASGILSARFSLPLIAGTSAQPINSASHEAPVFPQHRFNESRQATIAGEAKGYSWNVNLAPEIRSAPSVGYGTVYIGAHGSGELTALSLATGTVLWGVRVPNWIHHEPVIAQGKLFIGFGDNQKNAATPTLERLLSGRWSSLGSSPSGIQAVDAISGKFLWRHYTSSSMMASPVVFENLVIAREHAGLVHAWDLSSGKLAWSMALPLPGGGPMTNPLLVGDVVIVTSDPGTWCTITARDGSLLRCQKVSRVFYGLGHSSPAAEDSILVYHGISSSIASDLDRIPGFSSILSSNASSFFIEAVNWKTGRVLWRQTVAGSVITRFPGHIAGTPVIAGHKVIIVLPLIGEILALNLVNGAILWRKSILPSRGSPVVFDEKVVALTRKPSLVVFDLATGERLCELPTSQLSDRSGITIVGGTGIAAFVNGEVLAAPVRDWFDCSVPLRSTSHTQQRIYSNVR
jgi:outer membrane protein assembly factor BamB